MPTSITGENGVSQVQNNTITQADLTTAVLPLGVGQSWINQIAVRSPGVTYTNDTGRPIQVFIGFTITGAGASAQITVNGNLIQSQSSGGAAWMSNFSVVIPNGNTYKYEGVAANAWLELR